MPPDKKRGAAMAALHLPRGSGMLAAALEAMPYGVVLAQIPSGEIIYQNQNAATLLGRAALALSDLAEYAGLGGLHTDSAGSPLRPYALTDYPLARAILHDAAVRDHEMLYRGDDGELVWLSVSAAPLRDENGMSVVAIATYNDISERKTREIERTLAVRRERLLSDLSECVRSLSDADAILYESARMVGDFTGASRALFAEVTGGDTEAAALTVYRDFARDGMASLAGMTFPEISFGRDVFASLQAGLFVQSEDVLADPRIPPENRVAYAHLGIRAYAAVPIMRDGKWVSALVLNHATPRSWSKADRELLFEVAERARLAVYNASLRREQAESAERFRLAVGVAGLGTWSIDLTPEKAVNTLDAYTASLFGRHPPPGESVLTIVGDEWVNWIHPEDRVPVATAFAAALSGSTARYEMTYRAVWPDSETVRWVSALATIRRDVATNKPLKIVGVCRDISAEKEAAARQRTFLKEMLFGMTEGRLRLCDSEADLPAPLPEAFPPVTLAPATVRALRKQVLAAAATLRFDDERVQDLETAVGEAGMNAIRHARNGVGVVHADAEKGTVQIWVRDEGDGIAEHLIHRAVERGWTTGGFGQGMFLMHRTCDRVYLLTGAGGTTVVLEQGRTPPPPSWMRNDHE